MKKKLKIGYFGKFTVLQSDYFLESELQHYKVVFINKLQYMISNNIKTLFHKRYNQRFLHHLKRQFPLICFLWQKSQPPNG